MKSAPFFREIAAQIDATGTADVRLFAGDPARRWPRALARRAMVGPATATLLPAGVDPLALRWPACPVVADITGLPGDQVHALCEALARDGCELGYLIDTADAARSIRLVAEGHEACA